MKEKDLLVIGSGPGGYSAALTAARLGASVAVVEKGGWGGTCTHRGCIPTKALLAASGRYDGLRNLRRMGIGAAGGTFDFPSIRKHMEQMVRVSALGARKALEEAGVELVQGEARLKSPVEVEIERAGGERETAKARRIVIAWGSRSALPPEWRLSERVVTSSGFLAGKELPEKALVVGAGAIGLEFATFLAELGKDVSVVEFMDQVLPGEDRDVAETLAGELGKKGIRFFTSTRVEVPETVSGTVRLRGNAPGGTVDLEGDLVLVATGRRPNLRTEELDALSIRYDGRGVAVGGNFETSVPGIHAVGDVTGGLLLAHRAMAQGKSLAAGMFGSQPVDYREENVPAVVYTHPGFGRVGLTEGEARRRGLAVDVRKAAFGGNLAARTELAGIGFVKALFHEDRLLGAAVVGPSAGELTGALVLPVTAGMKRRELQSCVLPHPSLIEILGDLFS